jgi:hypothetical protein
MLAFHVAPRLEERAAIEIARTLAARVTDPQLYFLPYYRFTGEEFRWETAERGPAEQPPDLEAHDAPLELEERCVERNFLGCAWDGLNVYSLGVRPGVLKLALFHREALIERGRIVAADVAPDAALAHALRPVDPERIVHRAVLGGVLSLVYYPYWAMTLGGGPSDRLALLDAVSGTVATADAGPTMRARLDQPESATHSTVEFRPLVCPNCGWDLPADPGLVVFFCTSCTRAWQVAGDRLEAVPATVVAVPPGARRLGKTLRHLPVWVVALPGRTLPERVMVPAFRYRGLKLLVALATRLTRIGPVLEPGDSQGVALDGGHLDRTDAMALARIIATGLDRQRAPLREMGAATLAWLPFEMAGGSLRELRTGFALPAGGLVRDAAA